jgi:hypothetical protein
VIVHILRIARQGVAPTAQALFVPASHCIVIDHHGPLAGINDLLASENTAWL